jgi:DNA polymerase-3 subunit delta
MRVQFSQLPAQLRRLSPVYLVCGDEPLQLRDAAQAVREAAGRQGIDERELLEQDAAFDWGRLAAASRTLSLFASRRLIELRVTTPRLGRDGAAAVTAFCSAAGDDLLLILASNLESKELKAAWVQAVDRAGIVLQVRQLEGRNLIAWIEQRMRERGLQPGPGVAATLAERVEGNLLAAAQEVDKLRLLYGEGPVDEARLVSAITDSARYDVYDLGDAALAGDRARVQRIISGLAAEGTAPALVLWVLLRELRVLAMAAYAAPGGGAGAILDAHKVWASRRPLVQKALKRLPLQRLHRLIGRCALADRQIKGLATGEPWQTLAVIADGVSASEE